MAKDCPTGSQRCSEHGAHRWALGVLVVVGLALGGSNGITHLRVSEAQEEMGGQRLAIEQDLSEIRADVAVTKEIAEINSKMLTEVRAQLRRQWGRPTDSHQK